MAEVLNCSRCHALYNPSAFFSCCLNCVKEEEELYQKTYAFLRKRENRAATTEQIHQELGVPVTMLHGWVRKGRLRTTVFPNLSYPCDRCGALIQKTKLCAKCTEEIEKDLRIHEQEREKTQAQQGIYHSFKN